jgi:hypothetical protein
MSVVRTASNIAAACGSGSLVVGAIPVAGVKAVIDHREACAQRLAHVDHRALVFVSTLKVRGRAFLRTTDLAQ